MANEYVQVLGTTSTDITIANTIALTSLFSTTILGGLISTNNKVRWEAQCKISFANTTYITLYSYFAGQTVASCIVRNNNSSGQTNKGLIIEATICGDNSPTSQIGILKTILGIPLGDDASTPVGFGTSGGNSNGDQTFEIKGAWNTTGLSNSITHLYSSTELISYVPDLPTDDLDDPTAYIFINSKLNNLRYDLRKYAYFYAPLEHELDFYGYGDVTFTRAGSTTSTYRDGATHTVEANEPRFEYSGETVSGLALNTASETLNFSTSNSLNDSNTICWLENGVFKTTPTNTNPFNGSGNWTGTSGTHITQIVKFNKILTDSEISEVQTAIL
jgi:hypothetical protein